MTNLLSRITVQEWDTRYDEMLSSERPEPWYGGRLSRHIVEGDYRLSKLVFDPSWAALRLWNFLLTEETRLHRARKEGKKIIGTMKDLGTVPILVYSFPNAVAFYPDGAWWIPCIMEQSEGLLQIADRMGLDDSFCPVRAMIGAFVNECHFPIPDMLICSVGATCDDFSAIAQRIERLGHPILWWEIPHRRAPVHDDEPVTLPGGFTAPKHQIEFVKRELSQILTYLEIITHRSITGDRLQHGIQQANQIRTVLNDLRTIVFTSPLCPLPALELQVAEMLAIHYCSDRDECLLVLRDLLNEVRRRTRRQAGFLPADAVRIFWVNPVADLQAMNLLEECGGRLCGSDFLFSHALDPIPESLPPMEALARMALADPMVGSAADRAHRIRCEVEKYNSEAVIISRIPGASHCVLEGKVIRDTIERQLHIPIVEIEVPPLTDSIRPALRTRIEAVIEIAKQRRT